MWVLLGCAPELPKSSEVISNFIWHWACLLILKIKSQVQEHRPTQCELMCEK